MQEDKALTEISSKNLDYTDVFWANLAIELLKQNGIYDYAIKLIKSKQLFYRPIYSLGLVELEILKTYSKTYLKTWFIQPLRSSARAFILFDKKSDRSFCLYVNYQDLNKLTIKN